MVWSSTSKTRCMISVLALHLRKSGALLCLHEQGKFWIDWMYFRQWAGHFQFYVLSKNKEMIQKPFAISSNCKVLLPMECWKNTKRANGSTHRCYVKGSDAINPLARNKVTIVTFILDFFRSKHYVIKGVMQLQILEGFHYRVICQLQSLSLSFCIWAKFIFPKDVPVLFNSHSSDCQL